MELPSEKRRKTKQLEVMVADVIRETQDTTTLVLFTGNDRLDYQPGHFITIDPHQFQALERFTEYFEEAKGRREPSRAYSLSSAPHEKHLAITVKEENFVAGKTPYPPLLSPLLVWRTPPGARLVVTGFSGPYVLPRDIEDRTDHVVHICAGSGVVPNMSILKEALFRNLSLRHTVIVGNRTKSDIIFRHELDELARRHEKRLVVVHSLSREQDAANLADGHRQGRVSLDLLREFVSDPTGVEVFACGPAIGKRERLVAAKTGSEPSPRFMETVLSALNRIGVPSRQIHKESYG